jgi:PAS domain S-box-containing protein/putative nucleotidyltransferase with HDIG domain
MKDQSKTNQARSESERRKVEQALKESEENGWTILENIQEGYYEVDLAGNYTFFNSFMSKIFGYTKEEMMGMNYRLYMDKETSKKIFRYFNEVYRTGISSKVDYEQIKKDGSIIYMETSVVLMRDSFGQPTGFRGIVRDITERKRAEETLQRAHDELEQRVADRTEELIRVNEELRADITDRKQTETALRESEERLRDIIFSIVDWVWEVDENGVYTYSSQKGFDIFGESLGDIIGKTPFDFMPPDEAKRVAAIFSEIVANKATIKDLENWNIGKNGKRICLLTNGVPILDKEGNLKGYRGVDRDITERKQAEEGLRESEERYRALFDHSLDLVYITDFEGRFIDANAAALNRLGYTREEIHSLNFASLLSDDQLLLAVKTLQEIRETGIHKSIMEFRLRHKNGSDVYVETRGSTVMSNGTPVAIQAIARDITERKRAEEQLRESLEQLRRAVETTIQVLVMAVEMKDPYTAGHQRRMTKLARTMATEMGLPPEKVEGLRMAGVIHDIGKITLPTEVLSKPTKLSAIELSLIREHVRLGYEILKDVQSPWPLAEIVLQHHERMDGSGYPRGLKGEEILIEARILAVADVVEAMASHRPYYRPALGIDTALAEIEKNRGLLYDSHAVDTCLRVFREKGYQIEGT